MPELIQEAATSSAIAGELIQLLGNDTARRALETRFADMHADLQRNASRRAVDAIEALIAGQPLGEVSANG
ncbi:MAG: hypothetical protein R6U42_03000 [Halomonas sp.]